MDQEYIIDTSNPQSGPIVRTSDMKTPFLTIYYPFSETDSGNISKSHYRASKKVKTSVRYQDSMCLSSASYNQLDVLSSISTEEPSNSTGSPQLMPGAGCDNNISGIQQSISSKSSEENWCNQIDLFKRGMKVQVPNSIILRPTASNVFGMSPCKQSNIEVDPFLCSYSASIKPPEVFNSSFLNENSIHPTATSTPYNRVEAGLHNITLSERLLPLELRSRNHNKISWIPIEDLPSSFKSPQGKSLLVNHDTPIPRSINLKSEHTSYSTRVNSSIQTGGGARICKKLKRARVGAKASKL